MRTILGAIITAVVLASVPATEAKAQYYYSPYRSYAYSPGYTAYSQGYTAYSPGYTAYSPSYYSGYPAYSYRPYSYAPYSNAPRYRTAYSMPYSNSYWRY